MAQRITTKMLEARCESINDLMGTPKESYSPDVETGRYKANPGNYHLDSAYGGVQLVQMSKEGGGCRNVFNCGFVSNRVLYELLCAYIAGIRDSKDPL